MPGLDAAVQADENGTWNGAFMIDNYDSVDVFIGVDVGKGEHHAAAQNRAGKVLFDKALLRPGFNGGS
jgi:hypothetical protein